MRGRGSAARSGQAPAAPGTACGPDRRGRRPLAGLARASGLLFLLGLLAIWELSAQPDVLPPVSAVAREFWRLAVSGELPGQALVTAVRALAGFAVGGLCGAALGFCCGVFPAFGRACRVTAEFLRPMPSVALIPIGILFLGLGFGLNVAVSGFACAWPAYVAGLAGAGAAGPELRATALVYGCSRRELVSRVLAPAALPQVMAGLRVALGVAVAVAVTTEMAASPDGLGSFILEASISRRPERMYAGIVAVGLLGAGCNAAFVALRRRALRWTPGEARG